MINKNSLEIKNILYLKRKLKFVRKEFSISKISFNNFIEKITKDNYFTDFL